MVAALGTLWAFFLLARRFLPDSWSLGATALCAFNPMFLCFSVVAIHLVYALCFSVAGWACQRFRILSIVFLALACLSDWPGYFAVLAAAVDTAISGRWKTVVVMIGLALGMMALHLTHLIWIDGGRFTRFGAYEVNYRAGVAIHETVSPREKTLITIADLRPYTPFYADRYTAGVEPGIPLRLQVSNAARGEILGSMEDLVRFLRDFDVVLVGDPEAAAWNLRFFGGRPPPASFGFLGPNHPLRRRIEREAVSKSVHGAFLLYRMR